MSDKLLRNAQAKEKHTHFSLKSAFACAFSGLHAAFVSERNVKIHVAFAILVIAAGLFAGLDYLEWALIVLCIGLVFACELINTALESVVDLVSPKYSDLAKKAKDCAAAAVLIAACSACVVGLMIAVRVVLRWKGL